MGTIIITTGPHFIITTGLLRNQSPGRKTKMLISDNTKDFHKMCNVLFWSSETNNNQSPGTVVYHSLALVTGKNVKAEGLNPKQVTRLRLSL